MATVTFEVSSLASSSELQVGELERSVDVEAKHQQVAEFLKQNDYDALLLKSPGNFAWFTSGGDSTWGGCREAVAALFITTDARVVIAGNAESTRVFEQELPGLGFQLKERPWHESMWTMARDLCRGRRVASDCGFRDTVDVSSEMHSLRWPFSDVERKRCRRVGRRVAHAVEATARNCQPGQTEAEIAGEVAHRLIRNQIVPERLQVWADGRNERYPHSSYRDVPVEKYAVISAIGRRWGLCVGVSRTICFGSVPGDLRSAYNRCGLVQATGLHFSQHDWEWKETWSRVQRIYEKFGCADEWRRAEQAEVMGYECCDISLEPQRDYRLAKGTTIYWHPSVQSALLGDTILIDDAGTELLTPMEDWPRLQIEVKGQLIERPDVLSR